MKAHVLADNSFLLPNMAIHDIWAIIYYKWNMEYDNITYFINYFVNALKDDYLKDKM